MDDHPCREKEDDILLELRQQVIERDDHVCQRCRDAADTLEVHRLVTHSESEGSESLENLTTLCRPCHAVMHADDEVLDHIRKQAALFPHPDALEAISRMRTTEDHVCRDCESEIEDPTNLVSYGLSTEDETLILCTACKEKLSEYTGPMGQKTTRDKSNTSSNQTTETASTETDLQSSDDLLDTPISFIILDIFFDGLDMMSEKQDDNTRSKLSALFRYIFDKLDGIREAQSSGLRSKWFNFHLGLMGMMGISVAIAFVITEWILPSGGYSPTASFILLIIIGFTALVVDALSDLNTKDAAIRLGWAFVVVGSGVGIIYLGGWFIKIVLWHTIGRPVVSVFEMVMAVSSTTVLAICAVFGVVVLSLLYMSWRTGSSINWILILRMGTSLFLLFGLTVVFFTAVWRLIEITVWLPMMLLGIGSETQQLITNVVGIWLLIAFVYHELVPIIDAKPENATVTAPEKYPTIHAITNRIAAQLDIPVPTIAITLESGTETITWGYRPGNMTLILSQGTINVLDEEELEAVIAHELSHVANMDAIVMTIASLPVLLADGLIKRASQMIITEETVETSGETDTTQSDTESDFSLIRGILWIVTIIPFIIVGLVVVILSLIFALLSTGPPHHIVAYALMVIGGTMKYISRPFVSILSRSREVVADRTAAMVTGSPAALASALTTLDDQAATSSATDLREKSELSTLSIMPRTSWDQFPNGPSENANRIASVVIRIELSILEVAQWLFNTHPSTERRIAMLADLAVEQERNSE